MPTVTLSPVFKQKFFDNAGVPLSGGKLFSYLATTTTKTATYTDSTGGTPNTNPVILNFRGEADVWIEPNKGYKFVLAPANDTDPPTNPIWSVDNVKNLQLLNLYGGVDTGTTNAIVLNFTAPFTTLTDGIVIFFLPANTNTAATTINVNGLGPVPIVNGDGTSLSAGEVQANIPAQIMSVGGQFIIINPASLNSAGSFTATVTGCTTAPTKTVTWARTGRIVVLNVPSTGVLVSNSASFGMSGLPLGLQLGVGAASCIVSGIIATDNSVQTYAAGDAFISAASSNITFEFKGGAWTNSGNKAMGAFMLTYFVANNFS